MFKHLLLTQVQTLLFLLAAEKNRAEEEVDKKAELFLIF
jgi:hypothetical protein